MRCGACCCAAPRTCSVAEAVVPGVLEEPDPERRLRLNARNSRAVKERIGALFTMIRSAAALDADIEALWTHIQTDFYDNQRTIVEVLAREAVLADALDVARPPTSCGR